MMSSWATLKQPREQLLVQDLNGPNVLLIRSVNQLQIIDLMLKIGAVFLVIISTTLALKMTHTFGQITSIAVKHYQALPPSANNNNNNGWGSPTPAVPKSPNGTKPGPAPGPSPAPGTVKNPCFRGICTQLDKLKVDDLAKVLIAHPIIYEFSCTNNGVETMKYTGNNGKIFCAIVMLSKGDVSLSTNSVALYPDLVNDFKNSRPSKHHHKH